MSFQCPTHYVLFFKDCKKSLGYLVGLRPEVLFFSFFNFIAETVESVIYENVKA